MNVTATYFPSGYTSSQNRSSKYDKYESSTYRCVLQQRTFHQAVHAAKIETANMTNMKAAHIDACCSNVLSIRHDLNHVQHGPRLESSLFIFLVCNFEFLNHVVQVTCVRMTTQLMSAYMNTRSLSIPHTRTHLYESPLPECVFFASFCLWHLLKDDDGTVNVSIHGYKVSHRERGKEGSSATPRQRVYVCMYVNEYAGLW